MKIGMSVSMQALSSTMQAACLAAALLLVAGPAAGGLVMTCYSNNTGTAFNNYFGPCSGSDLIENGQSTLASSEQTPGIPYNWDTLNNGNVNGYGLGAENPWTNTFYLATNVNTLGYTITNVATYACWTSERVSQKYEILLAFVDAPTTFVSYGTVSFYYKPGGNMSTKVVLTGTAGAIANNVCAIRFAFSGKYAPDTGTIYQEADAFGYPSTTSGQLPVEAMITSGGPGGVGTTNGASSLSFWVKADSLDLANGATVNTWQDNSGRGLHVSKAGATVPTFVSNWTNSRPAVSFDGTTWLSATSGAYAVHEAFVVTKFAQASFTGYNGILNAGEPVNVNKWVVAPSINGGTKFRFQLWDPYALARRNGSVVPAVNSEHDFAPIDSPWVGLFVMPTDQSSTLGIGLGGVYDCSAGRPWKGEIAEVATFDRSVLGQELNALQRSIIENYLSAKYGIALASGEDKYAGSSAYSDGVFGIGRTDANTVHLNGGADGFGMQWYGGLHDSVTLFAGHSAGANSVSNGRWMRTWYVDGTGLAGSESVKLAFNSVDAGLGAANTNLKTLLYSATGSGPFQSVATGTYNGNTITFDLTGSQLSDGYYTLGSPAGGTLVILR